MKTLNSDFYQTAFQLVKSREDIERLVSYAKNDLGLQEEDCNIRELNIMMNSIECDNNINNINDLISYLELCA